MKILIVHQCSLDCVGGVETYIKRMISVFIDMGHQPVFYDVLPPKEKNWLKLLTKPVLFQRKIIDELRFDFNCQYEEKDSIGRRYRRQDAIGTPYCVTVDHQSLEDDTVTIRYRDTMEQERVDIKELREIIKEKVDLSMLLKTL